MTVPTSIDWGRTAAITTVALTVWRAFAWLLGLGWGRYVKEAIAPEFVRLRKELRHYRRRTDKRLEDMDARLTRIEGKLDISTHATDRVSDR